MTAEPLFPIFNPFSSLKEFHAAGGVLFVCHIPWSLIAPHEQQAEKNHSQSLRRLAERGGLSACEALAVLENRDWRAIPRVEAHAALAMRIASYQLSEGAGHAC